MNPHEEREGCESLMIGGIWPVKAGVFLAPALSQQTVCRQRERCHRRPGRERPGGITCKSSSGTSETMPFQSVDGNPAGFSSPELRAQQQPPDSPVTRKNHKESRQIKLATHLSCTGVMNGIIT